MKRFDMHIHCSDQPIDPEKLLAQMDACGIYGGVLEKAETISGVTVSFLTYEDIRYAIWEKDGFTFSLTGGEALAQEVAALIAQ